MCKYCEGDIWDRETLEKAKEELEEYDEDSNVAIYKVKEFKTIELKKVR